MFNFTQYPSSNGIYLIPASEIIDWLLENGFQRPRKGGNFLNALNNIKAGKAHTVELYTDGDVADGYHHLFAMDWVARKQGTKGLVRVTIKD